MRYLVAIMRIFSFFKHIFYILLYQTNLGFIGNEHPQIEDFHVIINKLINEKPEVYHEKSIIDSGSISPI